MNYQGKCAIWIWIAIIHQISSTKSEVTIFPNNLTVFEGSNGTPNCTYSGKNTPNAAFFTFNNITVALIYLSNCTNNALGNDNYRTDCVGNDTFTLTMINVSRNDHGKLMKCTVFLTNVLPEVSSNKAFIYVNVPVKRVDITSSAITNGVLSVCENVKISLHCKASLARPAAKLSLVYQSKDFIENSSIETAEGNSSVEEDNGLFITHSTFYIISRRLLKSWNIFCSSSNNPDTLINSSYVTLDILYPPDQSPSLLNVNITNGDTYRIIEGRQGLLTCAVPISNPNATLTWIDKENNQSTVKTQGFVAKKIEWKAIRRDKNTSTCTAKHECNNYTKSITVKIEVLYPPTIQPMNDVRIIEGSLLNIKCDIKLGIPESVTVKWTRQANILKLVTNSIFLTIQNISRASSANYTCDVANIMKPTVGIEERGESSSSVYIDVLYPPTVNRLKNQTVTEGLNFNITCPVNPGNPTTTNITWTSVDGGIQRSSRVLSFTNTSRKHAGIYTCTVFNIMNPTNDIPMEGIDSESFRLVVEYSATITKFFVNGYHKDNNVTISEHDYVTFHCIVDSLPISTTEIVFQNRKILKSDNSTNNVSYDLGPATCLDAGEFECSGRNKHNHMQEDAKKHIQLFVNCSPRAHPESQVTSNVTTALNVPLVVSFSAVAYPLPTAVNWQKFNGSNWAIIVSYNDTSIKESGLVFNLTFSNVQQEDLGQFKLVIVNDIGHFEHNFTIIPADIPKPPTDFHVLSEKTSTSSIAVEWLPSFDGGKSQYFVLNISLSNEDTWTNATIQDSGSASMTYTFERLESGTLYKFNIYAENIVGRSNISNTLRFKTKEESQGGSSLSIVVGVISGVIGAIVAVILVICFFRRRHQKTPEKSVYQNVPFFGKSKKPKTNVRKKVPTLKETDVDENVLQEIDDVPNVQTERTEYYNSFEKIEQIDSINVSELFQYVIGKDEDEFAIEYQKIPTELQKPCTFARKPENIALNRYNGIFPYDYSRVKIPALPDFFMNACYIDGFKKDRSYIASLGPTEKTTNNFITFWQMVWYERSDIIVMLTNLRELSGMKCEQYWPDRGSLTYGEISVSCLKTEIFAEYTVRRFTMSKDKEQLSVTHLHYTAWPDKTVPEDVTSLLEFRQRMITTPTTSKGPIIVHCSAGIGRTGTLIAIDRLVAEGQHRKSVDVFKCVKSMREQRVKMVQTLEQYIFVYKALVNALAFENESMTFKDLQTYVDEPRSSKYSRQFQQLKQTVEKEKKEEKEARYRNEKQTSKNRTGADIPGDRFRVFLHLDREDDSNYINSAYVNSFKRRDMFITSQTPLRDTVKDFINMVYQENCICIVTMDDLNESEKTVGKYITDSNRKTFGNFNVSSSILERKHQYILREMKIKYDGKYQRGEKSVYHFQYTQWLEENETPENAEDFVTFIKEVQQYANEFGDETSHILVHCLNAYERSSLFCVVSAIMEKLQYEKRASITNTVRHIRTRRRSAIKSKEQLVFCYTAAGAFTRLHDS